MIFSSTHKAWLNSATQTKIWLASLLFLSICDLVYFKIALRDASSNVRCVHALILCTGVLCLYKIFLLKKTKMPSESALRSIFTGFAWGAAGQVLIVTLFLSFFSHELHFEFLTFTLVLHAFAFAVFEGVFEEIFFRGLLLFGLAKILKNRVPGHMIVAVLIECSLFTLSHVRSGRLMEFYATAIIWSLLFTVLALKTRSLWIPIGVHAGYNTFSLIGTGQHRPGFDNVRGIFNIETLLLPYFFAILSLLAILATIFIVRKDMKRFLSTENFGIFKF